jgi:hypothetical protein
MAGVTGLARCRPGLEQKASEETKSGRKARGIDHRSGHGMSVREHE